ncbi:hypothetical protein ABK040_016282 [Willaertia magna]
MKVISKTIHLPLEMLISIFEYLEIHEIFNLSILSKEINTYIHSNDFKIKLFKYNFSNVVTCKPENLITTFVKTNETLKIDGIFEWLKETIKLGFERPIILHKTYKFNFYPLTPGQFNVLFFDLIQLKPNLLHVLENLYLCYEQVRKENNSSVFRYENIHRIKTGLTFGFNLIHTICFLDKIDYLKWLISKPPEIENRMYSNDTINNYLLKNRHLLVRESNYGQNCLHISVSRSSTQCMKYLIEIIGLDINSKDNDGYTCLHIAASKGLIDICKYLIEKGADKQVINNIGQRPFDLCHFAQLRNLLQ